MVTKGENVDKLFQRVGCLAFERLLAKESDSESRRESKGIISKLLKKLNFFCALTRCFPTVLYVLVSAEVKSVFYKMTLQRFDTQRPQNVNLAYLEPSV